MEEETKKSVDLTEYILIQILSSCPSKTLEFIAKKPFVDCIQSHKLLKIVFQDFFKKKLRLCSKYADFYPRQNKLEDFYTESAD